jgi:F-type H+-transporting ATPase subunit a
MRTDQTAGHPGSHPARQQVWDRLTDIPRLAEWTAVQSINVESRLHPPHCQDASRKSESKCASTTAHARAVGSQRGALLGGRDEAAQGRSELTRRRRLRLRTTADGKRLRFLASMHLLLSTLVLGLPPTAAAMPDEEENKGAFISDEWELHDWIPIHLGPLDLSINKAVAYLLLGALCSCLLGIVLMRVKFGRDPTRRQALGETIYEVAQVQVAEQGLPTKAIGRWFPYVATLLVFIWTINMLGFIPLPLSDEKVTIAGVELPTLAIFAATSTLSVTLALALMTFVFTHVEGIRANGAWRYFKSWIPEVPKVMLPLIVPLEILGQFMRLISLSVRLYANMLAGHLLILTFVGLIIVLENVVLAVVAVPAAALFYLFEVVIVVSVQAYIFAALSAIYIGSAIEPAH